MCVIFKTHKEKRMKTSNELRDELTNAAENVLTAIQNASAFSDFETIKNFEESFNDKRKEVLTCFVLSNYDASYGNILIDIHNLYF